MTSRQMGAILSGMDRKVSQAIQQLVMGIHGDLVDNPPEGTPVDTGWASNNWWPAVGSAPQGNGGDAGDPASRLGGQQAGVAQVLAYNYKSGKPLWVSNRVPYIGRLNAGWSNQSPAGFVEAAIERNINAMKGRKL